jgi:hypothetical protein
MLKLIAKLAAYAQAKLPVNRIVVLLTPAFVALSGYAAAWTGEHFPGLPQFTSAQITGFMVAGAAAGLTAAYRWLKGWEAHENRTAPKAPVTEVVVNAKATTTKAPAKAAAAK